MLYLLRIILVTVATSDYSTVGIDDLYFGILYEYPVVILVLYPVLQGVTVCCKL